MLWVKSFHIIAVVSWFAGLLYLPRLFVYHAGCDDTAGQRRFEVMESRLYRRIMGPAMAASIILGLTLLRWFPVGGWIVAKSALVVALVAFHIWCGRQIKRFAAGRHHSPKAYRICNEIPTVLLVAIVLLVTFKPF